MRWIFRVGGTAALGAGLLALLVWMLWPFAQPLVWAGMLAIVVSPLHRAILKRVPRWDGVSAFLVTGLVALIFVGPAALLGSALTVEAGKAYEGMKAQMDGGGLQRMAQRVAAVPRALMSGPMAEDAALRIEGAVNRFASSLLHVVSERLMKGLNAAFENFAGLMLDLIVVVLSIFIFLRDGRKWTDAWEDTVPLPPVFRHLLMKRLRDTTRSVVHVMFVAAAAQGVLLGLGFLFFGVPLPVLLGVIGFFASLIPYVGAATVWIPASLWLWMAEDAPGRAAGLFVYGTVFVSMVDNVLAPIMIGSGARMPAYAMFLGIIGGMLAMGPLGMFLGPVVFAMAISAGGAWRELVALTPGHPRSAARRR